MTCHKGEPWQTRSWHVKAVEAEELEFSVLTVVAHLALVGTDELLDQILSLCGTGIFRLTWEYGSVT